MKLTSISVLMGELAMKVQPSQLDELRSLSSLSEREKGEVQSCIKLLLFLRRKLPSDMALVDELLRLFEGMPSMRNLQELVVQFKKDHPDFETEPVPSRPSLPNGTRSLFRPSKGQTEMFSKTLLRISNALSWPQLEIMVALTPTPDANKERIREGHHLFQEMKVHGCISENDTELLESLFRLLNLKAPMENLLQYLSVYPPMIYQDEPTAPSFASFPSLPPEDRSGYSGPPAMSSQYSSLPGHVSYGQPYPQSSYHLSSFGSGQQSSMSSGGGVPSYQPVATGSLPHDQPHLPGDGSLPTSSQQAAQPLLPLGSEPRYPPHMSVPQAEESEKQEHLQSRIYGEKPTDALAADPTVRPFVASIAGSQSSLKSTYPQPHPVNVASRDEGQQPSAPPPGGPIRATEMQRQERTREHGSTEGAPAQKRPRTNETGPSLPGSYQATPHPPSSSQAVKPQGNVQTSEGVLNTFNTVSSTYTADIEERFLTPHTVGQRPPTTQHSTMQSVGNSELSYSAHPFSFQHPEEERVNKQPVQPSDRSPIPPSTAYGISSPSQASQGYVVTPKNISGSPNLVPVSRASRISSANTVSPVSTSAAVRPASHAIQRQRAPAGGNRTEGGKLVTSPTSDRNVDLRSQAGAFSSHHGAEGYSTLSTMSSAGNPSLLSIGSSMMSYPASINFPSAVAQHEEPPPLQSRSSQSPIVGGARRLYPSLSPNEVNPTENVEPSEESSFTTVSSNLPEEESTSSSGTSTQLLRGKRPRTRSQKGKEEEVEETSSSSKRPKTAASPTRKSKIVSRSAKAGVSTSAKAPEKAKVEVERRSLPSKVLSYLWPFGSKGDKAAKAEESDPQQSGEDPTAEEPTESESQNSDEEYESAKEDED